MNDPIDRLGHLIQSLRAPLAFSSAYAAGFDRGVNGPNAANCHFRWFRSNDSTAEWERGAAAGARPRRQRRSVNGQ